MFVGIERARPVETLVANFERVSAGGFTLPFTKYRHEPSLP